MAQCTATKANGDQCGGYAINIANGGTICAGHSGLGIAANPAKYAKAGNEASLEVRQTRAEKRKMSLLDQLSAATEKHAAELVANYIEAGRLGDWRATEALITRVHGKPVERVQVDAGLDPLGVAALGPAARAALLARALGAMPELRELVGRPVVDTVDGVAVDVTDDTPES